MINWFLQLTILFSNKQCEKCGILKTKAKYFSYSFYKFMFDFLICNKDLIQTISAIITTFAVGFAIFQLIVNKKQLNLSVIAKCITDFRSLIKGGKLDNTSHPKHTETVKQYIDLVNEELFYIQYGYLPEVVAKEWIDGMIDYLPITYKDESLKLLKTINSDKCLPKISENNQHLLKNYPRIKQSFQISDETLIRNVYIDDESSINQRICARERLSDEIMFNLKRIKTFI